MPVIQSWISFFLVVFGRYVLVAFIFWILFYKIKLHKIRYRKIQKRLPSNKDFAREITYSLISSVILATVGYVCISNNNIVRSYTKIYTDISTKGWLYFWLAFPIMFFLHDAYFYFAHRLMHHPALFKWVHLIHHKSTNPSPWAAFAFHPLEAVVEAAILPILLFTIPLHFFHILLFFLVMIVYNVYGHLGWELYPKNFHKHWLGKWVNTSINHNLHHQYFKGNYGLYFLWWDRWFGTIRKDYDSKFEEVKSRVANIKNVAITNLHHAD